MAFCSNCGKVVPDGAKFCTFCGAPLIAPTPVTPPPQEPVQPVTEPVFEAPAPAQPEPAQPVYQAPAPVEPEPAQPVYQAPAPVEPEPAQPVYQAPAPVEPEPVQPQFPNYQQPQQPQQPAYVPQGNFQQPQYQQPQQPNYAPQGNFQQPQYQQPQQPNYAPQGNFQQPQYQQPQQGYAPYTPPQGRAPKAKKGLSKGALIGIIAGGVALIALIIILAVVLGGKGNDPNLGRYDIVSMTTSGTSLPLDGEYLELKKGGKGVISLDKSEFDIKWKLDGEKLTLSQGGDSWEGTLVDGDITVDIEGLICVFHKDVEKSPASNSKNPIVGWYLIDSASEGGADFDLTALRGLGMDDTVIVFNEDGTGYLRSFGEENTFKYDDKTITGTGEGEEQVGKYTLDGDKLTLTLDTLTYNFVRGKGGMATVNPLFAGLAGLDDPDPTETDEPVLSAETPEPASEPTPAPVVPNDPAPVVTPAPVDNRTDMQKWWADDFYGWWMIEDATGAYESSNGDWWDCCASVTLDANGDGEIRIWDVDLNDPDDGLAIVKIHVSLDDTESPYGEAKSVSGWFMDGGISADEWEMDPDDMRFHDMFVIDGEYEDAQGSFSYEINLRRWGVLWDDIIADVGEDVLPENYYSWYVPAVQAGAPMPRTILGDYDTSLEPQALTPTTGGSALDATYTWGWNNQYHVNYPAATWEVDEGAILETVRVKGGTTKISMVTQISDGDKDAFLAERENASTYQNYSKGELVLAGYTVYYYTYYDTWFDYNAEFFMDFGEEKNGLFGMKFIANDTAAFENVLTADVFAIINSFKMDG